MHVYELAAGSAGLLLARLRSVAPNASYARALPEQKHTAVGAEKGRNGRGFDHLFQCAVAEWEVGLGSVEEEGLFREKRPGELDWNPNRSPLLPLLVCTLKDFSLTLSA